MNNFGTQFGVQVVKAFSPRYTLALSAQDNRGSFNQDKPRYMVGTFASINNGRFNFISALGQKTLGGVGAAGGKLTLEADISLTFRLFTRPVTLEAEGLFSNYGTTNTSVVGFSTLFQISLFDNEWAGDLDPFVRLVSLGESKIERRALRLAVRTGMNYNLPFTQKLLNFHAEYGLNHVGGPVEIVPTPGDSGEFRLEVRVNLTRYLRH